MCVSVFFNISPAYIFRDQRVYGIDLQPHSRITSDSDESPTPKSNAVALFKSPSGDIQESRNILAVTRQYICYSVRKNLLRVIQTATSEKALLRGHSGFILDLKFSVVGNDTYLCSVDDTDTDIGSGSGSGCHIFVWSLEDFSSLDKESSRSLLLTLPYHASITQPHPLNSDLWCIAATTSINNGSSRSCGGCIGIFSTSEEIKRRSVSEETAASTSSTSASTSTSTSLTTSSYSSLPMHVCLEPNQVVNGTNLFTV